MKSEAEIQMHIQEQKIEKRVYDAMKELIDATNVMGYDEAMAKGIFLGLIQSHRTLQQSFMRCFVMAMKSYAGILTDGRNEAAVEFAKKINEIAEDEHFPFI